MRRPVHSSCPRICTAGWAALLAAACGGKQLPEEQGGQQQAYDPCEDSRTLEVTLVADFESPFDPATGVNPVSGNDGTPGATFNLAAEPLPATKCAGEPAGSAYHLVATGLQAYGFSLGFSQLHLLPGADGAGTHFNATSWTGISMWVRKGSPEATSSFFAAVADRYTDPGGDVLFDETETVELLDAANCPAPAMSDCYCAFNALDVNGDTTPDPFSSQCDKFGAGIGMDTDWRFFKVPFSRMRQRAFGRPSELTEPERRILAFDFGISGTNIDFWLDELAFYREPAPGAAAE
jgi:hypothetical protein